ncbi:GNAT family N-acetyltransferase [Actinoplanes sp. KI2]|uniref:GNAT family N-acetyltransferase n=1 Tax=Actinoplanes sp. KI2 TaxID=2983315 RepID=UPI0021D59BB1|nr:GNAT family N-acetyltransferase [Actinoplanes sp. KI2]MCU7727279.1 GNAT family N-acetyltransferase [Actinoplanes sp. KI2]
MPELIAPTTRLHAAWIASRDEWGRGVHQDGAGMRPQDEYDTPEGFARWVRRLTDEEDVHIPPAQDWVHCTYRWMVEGDRVLGAISLRHILTDYLMEVGGHIGYGVRPSERRKGLAGWALGLTLDEARKLGLERVLITCRVANVASARTIEKAGGVFEDIRGTGDDEVRRYWITL